MCCITPTLLCNCLECFKKVFDVEPQGPSHPGSEKVRQCVTLVLMQIDGSQACLVLRSQMGCLKLEELAQKGGDIKKV